MDKCFIILLCRHTYIHTCFGRTCTIRPYARITTFCPCTLNTNKAEQAQFEMVVYLKLKLVCKHTHKLVHAYIIRTSYICIQTHILHVCKRTYIIYTTYMSYIPGQIIDFPWVSASFPPYKITTNLCLDSMWRATYIIACVCECMVVCVYDAWVYMSKMWQRGVSVILAYSA